MKDSLIGKDVWLKEDLSGVNNNNMISRMVTIDELVDSNLFKYGEDTYNLNMIDWNKTNKLQRGEVVWIRDDLICGQKYDKREFYDDMCKGEEVVLTHAIGNIFGAYGIREVYSIEMIDWDKTFYMEQKRKHAKELSWYLQSLIREGFSREEAIRILTSEQHK